MHGIDAALGKASCNWNPFSGEYGKPVTGIKALRSYNKYVLMLEIFLPSIMLFPTRKYGIRFNLYNAFIEWDMLVIFGIYCIGILAITTTATLPNLSRPIYILYKS